MRPWKGRLFALRQPPRESHARDTSTGTHGEGTHQEKWTKQSKEGGRISNQDERVRWQHSVNTNATVRISETGWAGIERQQRQQDSVRLDSAHQDTGRWQLLGIRERVRAIQEWITWETRQDISDAKDERSQDNECGSHHQLTSRRACWEYQARLQEGWSEWVATWLSKEEAEHNRVSAQSARTGRAFNNSGHPHAEEDNSNPNETEAGISSAQPILADHQTAPLSNTMTGGNTREHLDHPVGRTVCSEMDEGQKSAAEGRQKNIEVDTQQLPVTMENQRCGETEEEGARMRAAVRKSTRIAARGQRTDYTEVPRYDLPADWAQPYGKA